jgi:hypothetical protein
VFELPDAGGRAFLDQLYLRINQMPALRIVLIGLTRELASIELQLGTVPSPAPQLRDLLHHLSRHNEVLRIASPYTSGDIDSDLVEGLLPEIHDPSPEACLLTDGRLVAGDALGRRHWLEVVE